MDTKSKKSKPLVAWLCFFLAVSIMIGLIVAGFAVSKGNWKVFKAFFADYKQSIVFKQQTASYFKELFYTTRNDDESYLQMVKTSLDDEGDNIKYYAANNDGSLLVKNFEYDSWFKSEVAVEDEATPDNDKEINQIGIEDNKGQMPVLPAGYNYCWYFDGQKLWVVNNGKPIDVKRLDSDYREVAPDFYQYGYTPDELANIKVLLAVKDTLVENPYEHSEYYEQQQLLPVIRWIYISLFGLAILLFIYALTKRRDKREFDHKLASWSGKIWLEVKILLSLIIILFIGNCISSWVDIIGIVINSFMVIVCFWWGYILFIDLAINRQRFFTNFSVNWLLKWYHRYEKRYSWQKSMLKRVYMLLAAESLLALVSVAFVIGAVCCGNALSLLLALILAGIGIYIIYRYLRHYNQTINDLGRLIDHIELIKSGDMNTRLELAPDADIYPAACSLNSIQEGLGITVAEKIKSERMKIELITNVSHDLKTPLTSIISYVDLLAKEENLPDHVNDYIKILAQKSERLKHLIQDLFDLSKASSNNITLDMEKIDLVRLVQQVMGDMEEPINESGLSFRLNLPDRPVYIMSDGKKLYRVWENLVTNALKYSLTGSRVFIDLLADNGRVVATIKNTSNYEMNFTEEEILQRFARGDESRSTEGSGLGLSIAQSFTQLCGGEFAIKIDGDLFKVELRFTEL